MAELSWQQWISEFLTPKECARQLHFLLAESPSLRDVDGALRLVDDVECRSDQLRAIWRPKKNSLSGRATYLTYLYHSTAAVHVRLSRDNDGVTRITSSCTCEDVEPCQHATACVLKFACDQIDALRDVLVDEDVVAQFRVSAGAADLLQSMSLQSVVPTGTTIRSQSQQSILYILLKDEVGVLSRLSFSLAPILKSGEYSTARETFVSPSDFLVLLGQGNGYSSFSPAHNGVSLKPHATPDDLVIARHLFLAGVLNNSDFISLYGVDITSNWWDLLMCSGRVRLGSGSPPRSFQTGPILGLQTAWQRSALGCWNLVPTLDDGALLIPTSPPRYVVDLQSLTGPVVGNWSRGLITLVANRKALKDSDLPAVRAHLSQNSMAELSPPDIVEVDGGVVVPRPLLEFSWDPDNPRFDGTASPYFPDTGVAKLRLSFDYSGIEVDNLNGTTVEVWRGHTKTVLRRDTAFERRCLKIITDASKCRAAGLDVHLGRFDYFDEKAVSRLVKFQRQAVPLLVEQGWLVRLSTWWPGRVVRPVDFDVQFGDEDRGWLDFSMTAKVDGYVVNMLDVLLQILDDDSILSSLAEGPDRSWTFEVDNGYWIELTKHELAGLLPLLKALVIHKPSGRARITRFDVGAIESARGAVDPRVTSSGTLVQIAETLRASPRSLPAQTTAALLLPARDYQAHAAGWCAARRQLGFGAVIADEYAVGKTLQTLLTVHDAIAEPAIPTPSLIVVTKTLFFEGRWQGEIGTFLPQMRYTDVRSGHVIRRLDALSDCDVVFTTYDLLSRYPEAFAAVSWNIVAFDEAHRLGNHATKLYKAAEGLNARQKLAITGSPMQNSPKELWAIMNLVVPGLLRDRAWFSKSFPRFASVSSLTVPSEGQSSPKRSGQAENANRARLMCLGKMIGPFQLRRTNKELGRVLPAVVHSERRIALPQWQANVYEGLRVSTKAQVDALVSQDGAPVSKLHVFSMLLALRQAACDPRLVKGIGAQTFKQPSAKGSAIEEICEELNADRKRVVIVSEWSEWLTLIAKDLDAASIETVLLTGKLSGPQRKREIDRFRAGEVLVMLLQLSFAEGVELPEGDAIIVAEPWWNEKKIEQAIARLRRDERDKSVSVIRLHVPGSVEEGVRRIAQQKLDDIEAVHEGGRMGAAELTRDDIEAFFGLAQREDD